MFASPSKPTLDSTLAHSADHVAGIDEVGRGCLAGPVFAAAVILPPDCRLPGLADSKRLKAPQREALSITIRQVAIAWAVGRAEVDEIDRLNILQATFQAMRRAVNALQPAARQCWVDGNQNPRLEFPVRLIVGGDALAPCIMAASIVAKVARDAEMTQLCARYPGYGFSQHKGYGTPAHMAALRALGPSPLHRMSFAPCREAAGSMPDARCPIPA